jgi:transcriptional regulator with XRE-family HTH domain
MKERILEFLRAENKSSAQLAEEIGVQASGISHILSGRNNPSLDFVLKMLEKYKYLSSDWLLFGRGKMYKDGQTQSLFETDITDSSYPDNSLDFQEADSKKPVYETSPGSIQVIPKVIKIVWFFDDNRFEEYFPGK